MVGLGYYYRVHVRDLGLKRFDYKGDKVYVISPEAHPRINKEMTEVVWTNARRHMALKDIRLLTYLDRRTVKDQFGQPPVMDVYLGTAFFPAEEVEKYRACPSLAEAQSRWPAIYLDWAMTSDRSEIYHLARDERSAAGFPRDNNWSVSLNWVLFGMLPRAVKTDFRHTQHFKAGWIGADEHLDAIAPNDVIIEESGRGLVAASPHRPRRTLVWAFEFEKPWSSGYLRDIHTAWSANEGVRLEVSEDKETWRRVYEDWGGHRRRLFALEIRPEKTDSKRLYLRYTMEIKGKSGRGGDDVRGANLAFFDIGVNF